VPVPVYIRPGLFFWPSKLFFFNKILFLHPNLRSDKIFRSPTAQMAELVDALVSGTSVRKDVQVRVLFRAQFSPETGDLKIRVGMLE
jgi:hypothetical protein